MSTDIHVPCVVSNVTVRASGRGVLMFFATSSGFTAGGGPGFFCAESVPKPRATPIASVARTRRPLLVNIVMDLAAS
jgi:hypothetical protein